jgi:2-keto-4-pentenoate hydratase/2-oxohepta-3-ene-1,7-dioic acid hydratase in catechol pathway
MKIMRFLDHTGQVRYGVPSGPRQARLILGDLFGDHAISDKEVGVLKTIAPVDPPNILAIGLNYKRHADETGAAYPDHPLVFIKATTTLTAPGAPIFLPAEAPDEVDYEAELAIVIGKTCKHVPEKDVQDVILGYTCANDVSARDCQKRLDKQWARAKSFDTFCPLGPVIVTPEEVDPDNIPVRSILNDKVMQDSNTSDMIFSVRHLVSYLSRQFTLLAGTVILTGTPSGVGMSQSPPVYLRDGDVATVELGGIGRLSNPVVAEVRHHAASVSVGTE